MNEFLNELCTWLKSDVWGKKILLPVAEWPGIRFFEWLQRMTLHQ